MDYGAVEIDRALGAVLGHNVTDEDGRRLLRKGRRLDADDVEALRRLGRSRVWVARPAADDVGEDEAARRLAAAVSGPGVECSRAATGRVNLKAAGPGLLRVDAGRLLALNEHDGVTLATLRNHSPSPAGKTVGTIKILPYALPESTVAAAEGGGVILRLDPFVRRRAALVLFGAPSAEERLLQGFGTALGHRLRSYGAEIVRTVHVAEVAEGTGDGVADLARAIASLVGSDVDLLLLAGETAIQDRRDLAPRAVEAAGGTIECFGAPVDPGNLLLLAYAGDLPIVGAPGCARSPKTNIVDLVLPRLLAGDRLRRSDVLAFAHGGLLDDVPERPLPRSRVD